MDGYKIAFQLLFRPDPADFLYKMAFQLFFWPDPDDFRTIRTTNYEKMLKKHNFSDVIRVDGWAICTGLGPYLQEMFPQVLR